MRSVIVLFCLLAFGAMNRAQGSSARGFMAADYRRFAAAFESYRDIFRRYPTDGPSPNGPLTFSWRVHVLPFLELDAEAKSVLKAIDWSDPAIAACVKKSSVSHYHHWFFSEDDPQPILCRVLGDGAFFGDGQKHVIFDPKQDHSRRLWFVETEPGAIDNWLKPGDWTFDPANPGAGLASYWHRRPWSPPGGFAIFGDGSVRFLAPTISPDALRDVIAPSPDRPVLWDLSFWETLWQPDVMPWHWPFAVYSLLLGVAALVVLTRMARRRDVSPGEVALLAAGVYQATALFAFVSKYRYEYFPLALESADHLPYWAWPTVTASLAFLFGASYFHRQRRWSIFFVAIHLVTLLGVLPGLFPRWQGFSPEETLYCHATTGYYAFLGLIGIGISVFEKPRRIWRHWLCLAAFFLPLGWKCAAEAATGYHFDRPLFHRILE